MVITLGTPRLFTFPCFVLLIPSCQTLGDLYSNVELTTRSLTLFFVALREDDIVPPGNNTRTASASSPFKVKQHEPHQIRASGSSSSPSASSHRFVVTNAASEVPTTSRSFGLPSDLYTANDTKKTTNRMEGTITMASKEYFEASAVPGHA